MKIHVVMGNDYPAAAFDDDKLAAAFIEKMKSKSGMLPGSTTPRVYWRAYEFELNKGDD